MEKVIKVGDLVTSTKGRDRGIDYLVLEVDNGYAKVVDGKVRKINKPKRKSVKHLEKVLTEGESALAERIRKGESVGNQRIYRAIKAKKEKIQED